MKLFRSKKLKMISAISMTLFSLIVAFTGVCAWFTMRNAQMTNDPFTTDDDDINVTFTIYEYNIDTEPFVVVCHEGDLNDIKMIIYDKIFSSTNQYTPLIIRMEITGGDVPEEGRMRASLYRDTSFDDEWTDRTILNRYLTSIITFKAAFDSRLVNFLDGSPDQNKNFWDAAVYDFEHTDLETSRGEFPQGSSPHFSKLPTLAFENEYNTNDWHNDILNYYIYMNYSPDLIDKADDYFSFDKEDDKTVFPNDLLGILVEHIS